MKYVCPRHPDVVLFDTNVDPIKKLSPWEKVLYFLSRRTVHFGEGVHGAAVYIEDSPLECPKCHISYYKYECVEKP